MSEPDSVCLAFVHDIDVSYSWHNSIVQALLFDGANHGRFLRGGYVGVRCAKSSDLPDARNVAVKGFLADKHADWLFFIDTDMGFEPDTVERLLESADAKERPIVGALCFANKEVSQDTMSGYNTRPRVTIMDYIEVEGKGRKFVGRSSYPINGMIQCAGTGAACIVIHRSVLERIKEEFGETWYTRIQSQDGTWLGEDVSFCVRAGACGFPIFVDAAVKTTHLKNIWLSESDFWQNSVPPPATEECAILVPVMERPKNAKPFMESLRASTGMAKVYAIAHSDDKETISAWEDQGACVLTGSAISFADKVNDGYSRTSEPWMLLVGDDVQFHPGWLDHALAAGEMNKAHVVGTNDLGNPRVLAGEHATHMLIRRSYVDDVGASWDGPEKVCHGGYRHWYVDDEIVTAAKQRGVWAMSLASAVEHLHPEWGKAENDEVYSRGQGWALEDRKLFLSRLKKHS